MQEINIEDIMKEIREDINARGLTDNEILFSDISCLVGGTEKPFNIKEYLDDLAMLDESKHVNAYKDLSSGNKLKSVIKKVIRKMVAFYVEPLVDDQNRINELNTRLFAQLVRRIKDDDIRLEEYEKKIYKCERRVRELEQELNKVGK